MMHYYLPDTVNLRTLNHTLIHTMNNKPELFTDCKVAGLYGVLTPTVFAGGRIHMPHYLTESAMRCFLDYCKQNNLEYRFTFTNSKLTESHLHDTFGNLQLRLANEYDCPVIVASSVLENYIRNTYPNIRLIVSITTMKSFDDIQKSLACDDYYYTVVNTTHNEKLDKIDESLRCKAEILAWDCCPGHCPHRANCYANISEVNLGIDSANYSIISGNIIPNVAMDCVRPEKHRIAQLPFVEAFQELNQFCGNLTRADVAKLNALGYQSFKLGGRELNASSALLVYNAYFPKAECQEEFIRIMVNQMTI